jgi:tRNA1Val (adenine37-N6)-methyltransferase
MELKENERIDDLQYKGLKIIQNKKGFCFGIDAVLLSDFAKSIRANTIVVDMCSGTGVIPILLSGKTDAKTFYAVEIQKDVAEMARRSVIMNGLENKINVINNDINKIKDQIKSGTVDYITVNPPYKAKDSGIINDKDTKTISRHEISCTLEDVIREASRMLKEKGSIFMVHRPERLVDILSYMRIYKVEPKRIKFVHTNYDKEPNLVLIEGIRNGGTFLKIEKPLFIYKENGEYTDDIVNIYNI